MATTVAVAPTAVHVEIPDFRALSEQGHWDACAIIAEIAALHACPWATLHSWGDPAGISGLVKSWRNEYIAAGRWTVGHGTTLGNIYWHLAVKHGWQERLAGYIPYSSTPNMAALRAFIKQHTYHQRPVILFIGKASELADNEAGVSGHFVTLGGIDSTLGYLTANGDTLAGLKSGVGALIPTEWNTWQRLAAAGVNGAIALDRAWHPPVAATPPPPPPASNHPPDLHKLAEEALSAIQALQAALP